MSDPQKHSVERYIEKALLKQINRVFGVQVFRTKRDDFSDVLEKLGNRNTDRAVGMCFVRPTGDRLREDGYRAQALVGRGVRGSVAERTAIAGQQVPSKYNYVHPLPTVTEYEVSFTASEFSDSQRLWALWVQAGLKDQLGFRVKYQDIFLDVSTVLDTSMTVPVWGKKGDEREDMATTMGVLQVNGYTEAVTDSHVVPVILFPHLNTQVNNLT